MFSSINFLFLTSLAVTSWIILCYFKQIEEQRMEDIHEHFTMERSFEEPLRACRENYDLYLNFLCIFACIYALAKVTHITENFIAKHVHAKFLTRNSTSKPKSFETERHILEECKAQQEALVKQINSLKRSNTSLEQQLRQSREQLELQLRESQTQLEQQLQELQMKSRVFVMGNKLGGDDDGQDKPLCAKSNKSISTNTSTCSITNSINNSNNNNNNHNIFISNRHFHVNRQVYVNEGNVKLHLPEYKKDTGGFSQIWSKYLEMQKYAIKTPAARNPAHRTVAMPIVVSTEQLQSIQGLY